MNRADDGLSRFRLDGSVVLITGGASGIGRANGEPLVVASPAASMITGTILPVDGGFLGP